MSWNHFIRSVFLLGVVASLTGLRTSVQHYSGEYIPEFISRTTTTTTADTADDEQNISDERKAAGETTTSTSSLSGTNTTHAPASSNSSCFKHNSQSWLKGPRYSNINETLMDANFIKKMTLNLTHLLRDGGDGGESFWMSQSICPASSIFQNTADHRNTTENILRWRSKLLYLSALYHQQRHAELETRDRFSDDGVYRSSELASNGIGNYDYECPDAKFLVVSLKGFGLGINMRGGPVRALLAGLVSDRVVIVANQWPLASCDRQDYQCFYMPPTPCVLTKEDLKNGYKMKKGDIKKMAMHGKAPSKDKVNNEKVWLMEMADVVFQIPTAAKKTLHKYSTTFIDALDENDPRVPILRTAAESLLEPSVVSMPLTIYFMRPNFSYGQRVDEIYNEISKPVNPENSIGLLIRASDKCGSESECLPFSSHMEVISNLVEKDSRFRFGQNFSKSLDPTIVFTTESKATVKQQEDFMSNASIIATVPFNFHLATNTFDVHPDTGAPLSRKKKKENSPDEVMLSAVSTLKFQLLPRVTVGNCCSNFHRLVKELLANGCGGASSSHFHCMAQNEDPRLRLCCKWDKKCFKDKKLAIQQYEQKLLQGTSNNITLSSGR